MPGPVSDSYDPEFSTSSNVKIIKDEINKLRKRLGKLIGSPPKYILDVIIMKNNNKQIVTLSEKELRIIRFMTERTLETL